MAAAEGAAGDVAHRDVTRLATVDKGGAKVETNAIADTKLEGGGMRTASDCYEVSVVTECDQRNASNGPRRKACGEMRSEVDDTNLVTTAAV